jgi:hypothetical protein
VVSISQSSRVVVGLAITGCPAPRDHITMKKPDDNRDEKYSFTIIAVLKKK